MDTEGIYLAPPPSAGIKNICEKSLSVQGDMVNYLVNLDLDNETLTRINTRYCKEKILNTTYNPPYNQIPTRETTVQPGNYEILEMA